MRFARLSPFFGLLCASITAGFVACSSDVNDEPSGAASSAGGAGGEPSSSSSSMTTTGPVSSSSSSSSSSASSTGPGGGPCEEACAKIANRCGFGDVCSMIPQLDCTSAPNADCYGTCVLAADCADIITLAGDMPEPVLCGCLEDCGGFPISCGGGQGGAGGGAPDCQGCAQSNCLSDAAACIQDTDCGDWIMCVGNCAGDSACLANCDTMYAAAQPLYSALETCLCASCSTDCAAVDPCNTGTGSGGAGGAPGTGGAGGTGGN